MDVNEHGATRHEAMALKKDPESAVESNIAYTSCCQSSKDRSAHHDVIAINQHFQWAALIHLNRRVLGLPSSHPDV